MGCSLLGQFNARDVVIGRCLLQKKSVGASEIEEPSLTAILADQLDAACKLTAEHGFGGRIVRIAVAAGTGEIFAGVVRAGVEARGVGASEAAARALPDVAAVPMITEAVIRDPSASWAGARTHRIMTGSARSAKPWRSSRKAIS